MTDNVRLADLTIPAGALKALGRFAPLKDVRHYLNTVAVCREEGRVYLVATDGHALAAVEAPPGAERTPTTPAADNAPPLIPAELLKKLAIKAGEAKRGDPVRVTIRDGVATLELNGRTVTAPETEGRFPDWTAVIPRKDANAETETPQLDPLLFARFGEAARDLGLRSNAVHMEPTGDHRSPVRVSMPEGNQPPLFGVIMPTLAERGRLPGWLTGNDE